MKSRVLLLTILSVALVITSCKNSSQDAIKAKRQEEMSNKENRVISPAAMLRPRSGRIR